MQSDHEQIKTLRAQESVPSVPIPLATFLDQPDDIRILQLLASVLESPSEGAEAEGPSQAVPASSSACAVLPAVCAALVHGVPDDAVQSNGDDDEEGEWAASFLRCVQLELPLQFSAVGGSTANGSGASGDEWLATLAGRLAEEEHWVGNLLLPLFQRWKTERREQLQSATQGCASGAAMDRMLQLTVDAMAERYCCSPEVHCGPARGADSRGGHLPTDPGGADSRSWIPYPQLVRCMAVFGCLAEASGSYRTLCVGAAVILHLHVQSAMELVRQAWQMEERPPPFGKRGREEERCASAGEPDPKALAVRLRYYIRSRMRCVTHSLCQSWCVYLELYNTSRLYHPTEVENNGEGDHVSGDLRLDEGLHESTWLYLMVLLVKSHQSFASALRSPSAMNVDGLALGQAACPPLESASPAEQSVLLTQLAVDQLFIDTRHFLQRYVTSHLSVPDEDFNYALAMPQNVLAVRDMLWYAVGEVDTVSLRLARCGLRDADRTSASVTVDIQRVREALSRVLGAYWYGLLQIYGTLTAAQLPDEEGAWAVAIQRAEGVGGVEGDILSTALADLRAGVVGCLQGDLQEERASVFGPPFSMVAQRVREEAAALRGVKRGRETNPEEKGRDTRDVDDMRHTHRPVLGGDGGPLHKLRRYLSGTFYRVYHPSCFSLLQGERQGTLTRTLEALHQYLTSSSDECLDNSMEAYARTVNCDEDDGVWRSATEMLRVCRHQWSGMLEERVQEALLQEPRFTMCLVHATFVLLERRGSVAPSDEAALVNHLLPVLTDISTPGPKGNFPSALDTRQLDRGRRLFCLLTLISADLLLFPWSVQELYLALLRYRRLCLYALSEHGDLPSCLRRLEQWVVEGGGSRRRPAGADVSHICNAADAVVQGSDDFLKQITHGGTPSWAVVDERYRAATPLHFPAPCGTVLLVAAYKSLAEKFGAMRVAWVQQRQLVDGQDALAYLGRTAMFCTAQDVIIFRVLVQLVHRMLFAFQWQPRALLQLWFGYLYHIFTYVVPPNDEASDTMQLLPNSLQQQEVETCFGGKARRTGWRALQVEPGHSSQLDLRVALGELLADLALMPLSDGAASVECPPALPMLPHSSEWVASQERWREEHRLCQRMLPHTVLELLCLFLHIEPIDRPGLDADATRPTAALGLDDKSFLGLPGVVAFCRRVEECVVPGTFSDKRLEALLRSLWKAADAAALGQ